MKTLYRSLAVVAACLASLSAGAATLNFVTEDYAPFNMPDHDDVTGISTDLLREALARSGIAGVFTVLPWERALRLAREHNNYCAYSAVRNSTREKRYRWIGPLVSEDMTLFARFDSTIQLKALDDAKGYLIGGYNGDAYTDYLITRGFNVDKAPRNELNLPKLMAGRLDLMVGGARNVPYMAAQAGMKGKVKPIMSFGELRDGQMWLACNPNIDDDTLRRLAEAIGQVQRDGTMERIYRKYY